LLDGDFSFLGSIVGSSINPLETSGNPFLRM